MLKTNEQPQIWGRGAYSVSEASRLSRVPISRLRRWLLGRRREYQGNEVIDEPLWSPELPPIDGNLHLTFRDLIELRVVDRFRHMRVSMPYLRKVVKSAQDVLQDTHPFSNARLKTDGKRLYVEIVNGTDEPALIEFLSGQHNFHSIIAVGLQDVTFEDGQVAYWQPNEGRGEVVVDPRRSLGQPVLRQSGVATAAIRLHWDAGRSPQMISRDFEIDEKAVRAALRFEAALAA